MSRWVPYDQRPLRRELLREASGREDTEGGKPVSHGQAARTCPSGLPLQRTPISIPSPLQPPSLTLLQPTLSPCTSPSSTTPSWDPHTSAACPPRGAYLRDSISLCLATTTQSLAGQPPPCLLLSPWRPQCHSNCHSVPAPPGQQLPPRGHHQHSAVTASAWGSHQSQPGQNSA